MSRRTTTPPTSARTAPAREGGHVDALEKLAWLIAHHTMRARLQANDQTRSMEHTHEAA